MKSRESKLRLKRFEAEEKARKVEELESMIRDFDRMASDLDRQIASEEERSGIKDPDHYAYSTFAKAAGLRRDNLAVSVDDLKAKLELAIGQRDDALEALQATEAAQKRQGERSRHSFGRAPALPAS